MSKFHYCILPSVLYREPKILASALLAPPQLERRQSLKIHCRYKIIFPNAKKPCSWYFMVMQNMKMLLMMSNIVRYLICSDMPDYSKTRELDGLIGHKNRVHCTSVLSRSLSFFCTCVRSHAFYINAQRAFIRSNYRVFQAMREQHTQRWRALERN